MLGHEKQYALNADGDSSYRDNHMKVNDTERSAALAAQIIVERFGLAGAAEPSGHWYTRDAGEEERLCSHV